MYFSAGMRGSGKFKSSVILCDMKQVCVVLVDAVKHMLCFNIIKLNWPALRGLFYAPDRGSKALTHHPYCQHPSYISLRYSSRPLG